MFRLASGSLLGPDRPIELRLLEIEPALQALEGVVMELDDCAFPLLSGVEIGSDPQKIFDGVSLALLVGAAPGARAWSEVTCWRPTARSSPLRAKPSTLSPRMTFASG